MCSPTVENFQNDTPAPIDSNISQSPEDQVPETDPPENSSANSSLNKMESLLVEEDENDEDDDCGLGSASLRMSDSDDEDGDDDISSVHRKRPTQQIIESDDDEGKVERNDKNEDEQENGPESDMVVSKPKKFSALIDSDSEPEETEEATHETEDSSKVLKKSIEESNKKKKKSENLKKKKLPSASGSNSESEEESEKTTNRKKVSDLVDSDSESSNAGSANEDEHQDQENEQPTTKQPKKPQRASAKKAMDEMQAIQSETQRLYRETQVNIPYHKPKRHTLKEFLTRKTIVKPTLHLNGPGKSLKMTPEELEEYAKQLEERAKEASEFFKSESEDETMNIQEDEDKQQPSEEPMETTTTEQQKSEDQPEATHPLTTQEIDKILEEHEFIPQPSTQELLAELQSEPESQPTASTSTAITPAVEEENKPAKPSALAELKRRLLIEKNIPLVPKLKGDSNMIIDFETGDMFARKPTGVENLFERFIKSNKNNKIKSTETTPSQELQTTLKVAVIQESNKEKEPKPGAAYVKLKENLRALISRKRKEEFQKKIEETKEEKDEYNKCCGLDDEDEEEEEEEEKEERESQRQNRKKQHEIVIDDEENEIGFEECENDEEDEEETEPIEDQINDEETEETPEAVDEENVEENQGQDDEENENESDSSSSSSEDENPEDPSTRKHRVIKAFQDSDDEDGPGLNETSTSALYAEEGTKNPEEVEDELLDLCSGKFAETQAAPVISQIPITQTPGNVNETELEDLCSGVFNEETAPQTQIEETQVEKSQKTVLRIVSSDEEKEPDEDASNSEVKKIKKLKKKKKKHLKLGFSDDEEDDDEEQNSADEEKEEEDEEEEEEIPQTFIDYDSEENEIEVQMSKKDCVKQANAFLEKEAELSESEWGSADEDERNLDKYDMELGDEDEFDQQKLQSELEQIHMRKVLDDDIREVKKIQEMLFDDEEADGVGRQRKFRWKNAENGFSLDDPAGGGGADNDEQVDSADDDEEMKWRKMRFEREQFLLQKSKEEIIADVATTEIGKRLLKTIQTDTKYRVEEKEIVAREYKEPFLIQLRDPTILRHSLLNHDKETVAKMAEIITKSGDYDKDGEEGIQKKASKDGIFVFAPLTEEQKEMRKRKAEERKQGNVPKKIKTCTKSLLLDKLLD